MTYDSMGLPPQVPFHLDASLLGRILQNFPNGSFNIFDRELRFLLAEGRGLAALGMTPEQFTGKSLQEIFPAEIADYTTKHLKQALTGENVEFELSYHGHYYTISASPLADNHGYVYAVLAVATEITEYRHLQGMRDQLLLLIAHDLKSPLSAIKNLAHSSLRHANDAGLDDKELLGNLTYIELAADNLMIQINLFLQTTETISEEMPASDYTVVDLVGVVDSLAVTFRRISPNHQIELQSKATQLIGNWSRRRLELALANLLSNAIKFSPGGGTVRVHLTREEHSNGAWAIVGVSDPGIGIPDAELDRVFERFYRASNVVGRFDGTGNGLAGVRAIIGQHGGTISVQSREGSGSTFTVRLPLQAGEAPGQR